MFLNVCTNFLELESVTSGLPTLQSCNGKWPLNFGGLEVSKLEVNGKDELAKKKKRRKRESTIKKTFLTRKI